MCRVCTGIVGSNQTLGFERMPVCFCDGQITHQKKSIKIIEGNSVLQAAMCSVRTIFLQLVMVYVVWSPSI